MSDKSDGQFENVPKDEYEVESDLPRDLVLTEETEETTDVGYGDSTA